MPSTVTVTVEQGGAGFAANEDLSVKKVDPEGRCDEAGVEVGRRNVPEAAVAEIDSPRVHGGTGLPQDSWDSRVAKVKGFIFGLVTTLADDDVAFGCRAS